MGLQPGQKSARGDRSYQAPQRIWRRSVQRWKRRVHVRFFLDYGSGWEDQGVSGFNVHDIPNSTDCHKDATKPISYVASFKIDPKRKVCRFPVLPRVRAILSWQAIPPAGNANYPPVWGNVFEDHIQIKPWWRNLAAAFDQITVSVGQTIEIPDVYKELLEIPIPLPDPPDPPINELAQLYGATDTKAKRAPAVEAHRFGLSDIQAAIQGVAVSQEVLVAKAAEWQIAGLDLSAAIAALNDTKANTNYEELECLGLDNNSETLAATFRIKLTSGYSGRPCDKGSFE